MSVKVSHVFFHDEHVPGHGESRVCHCVTIVLVSLQTSFDLMLGKMDFRAHNDVMQLTKRDAIGQERLQISRSYL